MKKVCMFISTLLIAVQALTCKDTEISLEDNIWFYYYQENDYHSHVGPLSFKNGQIESVNPEDHGTIITLGTYTLENRSLKLSYYIVSMYSTPECSLSEGPLDRKKCLEAAKKAEYPLRQDQCTFKFSQENLFHSKFFLCDSGVILATERHSVPLSAKRRYQGVEVRRIQKKAIAIKSGCLLYETISPNITRSSHLNDGLAQDQAVLVLGHSRVKSAITNGTVADWLLIFVEIEPIEPKPLWIQSNCIGGL